MRWALLAIGLSQLIGFLCDLVGLRSRSFAWLKLVAGRGLARVLVVQLAIIFGIGARGPHGAQRRVRPSRSPASSCWWISARPSRPKSRRSPTTGPAWLLWIMKKCFPKDDFAAQLRFENAKRRREMADDELPQK